ncbi:MAG: hypothetical protein ACM3X8_05750 [Methanomicrobiales archaeon]
MVREERELQAQFSKRERTRKLLDNLEKLNSTGSLGPEQYAQMKKGYEGAIAEAGTGIGSIKENLSHQLTAEQRNLEIFITEQRNNEARFQVGELKQDEFARMSQRSKAKTEKIRSRIAELDRLLASNSSADVGGYVDKQPAAGGGGLSRSGWVKVIVGAVIVGIVLGVYLLLFSGLFASQPEDVVVRFLQHLDKGEYAQALDLAVNPTTLQPYTSTEKAQSAALAQAAYGMNGENIQISDIRILNKEKVSDTKYLITVSAKYAMTTFGYTNTQTRTETIPVVKVNGDWKVAQRLPGFEAVLGILALLGMGYRMKGRA